MFGASSRNQRLSRQQTWSRRLPFGWVQGALLALVAMVVFDVLLSFGFGVLAGFTQALYGVDNVITQTVQGDSLLLNFLIFTPARLLAFLFVYGVLRWRGGTLRDLGFRSFAPGKSLLRLSAAFIVFLVVSGLVFAILEHVAPGLDLGQEQDIAFTTASTVVEMVLAFMALIIIAPIVEETLFRGLLFPSLAQRFGVVAAAVMSSVLFGAIHAQLNVAIVTFLLGLLLAWLYYKTDSLWPAIMLHSLKNLVAFVLIFNLL